MSVIYSNLHIWNEDMIEAAKKEIADLMKRVEVNGSTPADFIVDIYDGSSRWEYGLHGNGEYSTEDLVDVITENTHLRVVTRRIID